MKKLMQICTIIFCFGASIVPVMAMAQIEPDPAGPVDYGPSISTNQEKLFACYSLMRQMIDEYNAQAELARSDKVALIESGKWQKYMDVFNMKLDPLLEEYAGLKDKIRDAHYTQEQWQAVYLLPDDDQNRIYHELYGYKDEESGKLADATYGDLDELKQVVLASLDPAGPPPDPVSDFTSSFWNSGVAQANPYSHISSINSTTVLIDDFGRNEATWFYSDWGTDHWSGDFSWTANLGMTAHSAGLPYDQVGSMALANTYDSMVDIRDANGEALVLQYRYEDQPYLRITEITGGTGNGDLSTSLSVGQRYWVNVVRNEGSGYYRAYIYDDEAMGGGDLVDTITENLDGNIDFRYVFAIVSWQESVSGASLDAWLQNLDVGESPPSGGAVPYSFGYILGG